MAEEKGKSTDEHTVGGKRRRQDPRLDSLNLVCYTFRDVRGNVEDTSMVRTLDISESGIKLECLRPFPLNGQLELEMAIGGNIVQARGQVLRVQKATTEDGLDCYWVGVRFLDLSEDDRQIIKTYFVQRGGFIPEERRITKPGEQQFVLEFTCPRCENTFRESPQGLVDNPLKCTHCDQTFPVALTQKVGKAFLTFVKGRKILAEAAQLHFDLIEA